VEQDDLFGGHDLPDEFVTALERYGVWPTTVWECDFQDQKTKRLKRLIGDGAELRAGAGKQNYRGADTTRITESIFNPAVAAYILNCFAPVGGGLCFDPFAGGGTRAIMAAKHGLNYLGIELRAEEVTAVLARVDAAGLRGQVQIECGDSRDCTKIVADGQADFLMTCPPYWNLEKYGGGPNDLSMAPTYSGFLEGLTRVVRESRRVLHRGALACWVVGLHRDKDGGLLAINHDVANIHQDNGFALMEEIVLAHTNNGAIQRVGMFEKGNHRLIRIHEYCLIFRAQ